MRDFKLKLFVKQFNNDRVYYDPKFQRRKVWQSDNKNKFLESLTLDRLVNPIAVVEVDSCLKFSEELRDQNSIEYFGQLRNEGYKYVSIDGQNRTKFLIEFMNNECGVQGSFKDADDNIKKYSTTIHFCHLPQRLKDKIKDSLIEVKVLPPCLLKDLADLCIGTNSGVSLNAQELRQALMTPLSDWVREVSKKNNKALMRIVKKSSRMQDDELVAKFCMVLDPDKNYKLNTAEIDNYYKKGLEEEYEYKDLSRRENIINNCLSGS